MDDATGGHYLDTDSGPVRLDSPLIDMRSTEVPERFTAADGTVTEGTIRVVHAPGEPVPDRLDTAAPPTEPRWCPWHDGMMPADQGEEVGTEAPGDPSKPCYACRACMQVYGILPLTEHPPGGTGRPICVSPRFIGRRNGLPLAPGELA